MGLIIKLQRQHVGIPVLPRDFDVNAERNSLKCFFSSSSFPAICFEV